MTDDASTLITTTLYDALGGAEPLRRLTRRMYGLMAAAPEARAARAVHPPDLAASEEKFFEFMTGWLGGPQLYVEKHGPPMLRRRHFVASIGPREIVAWLYCFETALEETVTDEALRETIREPIRRLALHMRNQE